MVPHTIAEVTSAFVQTVLSFTPHPTQRLFLDCPARVQILCAGRRWGKTKAAAAKALHYALTHPGSQQFVIAPTLDQASVIFNEIRRQAENGLLAPLAHVTEVRTRRSAS